MISWRKSLLWAMLLATASALAGCMTILDSSELGQHGSPCRVSTGAYHLPRRLIKATVTLQKSSDRPLHYDIRIDEQLIPAADNSDIYCLDYLENPFAEDRVGIQRTPDGLLERVFTQAVDKSGEIAIQLIEGIGRSVAGASARTLADRIRSGESTVVGEYEFDPFNKSDMRDLNSALRMVGYCVYLDPRNDQYVEPDSGRQCGVKPSGWHATTTTGSLKDGEPVIRRPHQPHQKRYHRANGIKYRPNITHTLVVLQRKDPGSGDPWELYMKRSVEMPNAAPVFTVQVERSWFVERKTDLQFDKGVLVDVSIKKDSEINAFMNIPLAAAQVIVAIPTQILKIRLNTAENRQAVIQANATLLETLRQQQCEVDPTNPGCSDSNPQTALSLSQTTSSGIPITSVGGDRSLAVNRQSTSSTAVAAGSLDQCVQQCRVDGRGTEPECRRECSCKSLCFGRSDDAACRGYCEHVRPSAR